MHNNNKYSTSDAAQPAYVYKNNRYVNPAFMGDMVSAILEESSINNELIDALKHRIKRAKKSGNRKKLKALESMMIEIKRHER